MTDLDHLCVLLHKCATNVEINLSFAVVVLLYFSTCHFTAMVVRNSSNSTFAFSTASSRIAAQIGH